MITARQRSWDKVVFLQVSIILFGGMGTSGPRSLPGWGGVGMLGSRSYPGERVCQVQPRRYATEAGSAHPIGLLSSLHLHFYEQKIMFWK